MKALKIIGIVVLSFVAFVCAMVLAAVAGMTAHRIIEYIQF